MQALKLSGPKIELLINRPTGPQSFGNKPQGRFCEAYSETSCGPRRFYMLLNFKATGLSHEQTMIKLINVLLA